MDSSDCQDDGTEVQVAQVSATVGETQQPIAELWELQGADSEVGQIVKFLQDDVMPVDAKVQGFVLREKDRFVVLDDVLYYVDSDRKDRVRLVVPEVLRKQLIEEVLWTCAAYKGGGRRTRPPLKSIPVGGPFERVGVDLMEMPLTAQGNRYIIVFLDYLTKWVEAYPLQDQTSETIARVLVDNVICQHGVPCCCLIVVLICCQR